ncbi:MAG: tRNA glutamyl-Q(34) synthetase GluQRS, partial [Polyangiaceae bacterium]
MFVTRFAPSPTGDLHFGGAFVALASWWLARKHGGRFVVRMEDIDTPRVVPGAGDRILDDLAWLGLTWDGEIATQSKRTSLYLDAIENLKSQGLVYACDCSRAELARIASAPHGSDELVYPGLCANADPQRVMKRDPALRVRAPRDASAQISFEDEIQGKYTQNIAEKVGDFVIRRGDGIFSYQLAVTVDDTEQGVTHVIRGADLLSSTPRQIFLARALGHEPPAYMHLPLVLDVSGGRIAKRSTGAHVRALREAGVPLEKILGDLAHALGLTEKKAPIDPPTLAGRDR